MTSGNQYAAGQYRDTLSWSRSSFGDSLGDPELTSPGPEQQITTAPTWRPPSDKADFVSVVTAISNAYQCGQYLKMRSLNKIEWDELGSGRYFQVSRSNLEFEVISSTSQTTTKRVLEQFVIKRSRENDIKMMNAKENAKFVHELRILDHLRHQPHIVELKGIAWFYYHDDDLKPCPRPVFLLERATKTLESLILETDSLDPKFMISMLFEISSGLQIMHNAGIVHGDVKPDNILLFPRFAIHESAIEGYSAKLSDFSHAILQPPAGEMLSFHGGTPGYVAPELPGRVTWEQLKLTDVWSLGMLISVVVSQSFEFRNLARDGMDTDELIQIIHTSFRHNVDNSAMSIRRSQLMQDLCSCTLQKDAASRHLDRVVQSFEEYLQPEIKHG